jgi:hypothetical protein
MLTNDVLVNEWGTRQILTSFASVAASSNEVYIADKELRANEPLCWILHNPLNGKSAHLPHGGCFDFNLKTLNGVHISKTEQGERLIAHPKSLTNVYSGNFQLGRGSFPALTNLFNFPSNGVYVFELRCWAWQTSKGRFALLDPIRVKVIAQTINPTNSISPMQTNLINK